VIVLEKFKGKKKRRDKLKARAIALPCHVQRLLRNLHRKAADTSADARVFIASRGSPWTPNGVRCAMREARRRCGLDGGEEKVTFYHLRHTGATEALRNGEDLTHLAQAMGHARTSTTERYVHLNTADVIGTIDRIHARPRAKVG
jgi:integrase/recombinase XerC